MSANARQKSSRWARALPKVERDARTALKTLRQRIEPYTGEKMPVFVFGCQRSGTNMLVDVLANSAHTQTYQEDNGAAFVRNRLKSMAVQHALIRRAACRVVVFKPITESQHASMLLDAHPNARAIWIFRDVDATSASAVDKWGDKQITLIRRLCDGTLPPNHWLTECVPDARRAWACEMSAALPNMTAHEAASIKWVLRNAIYFDLGLHERADRVLLVRYEDITREPSRYVPPVFAFLGLPFEPAYTDAIKHSANRPRPAMDARLRAACDELTAQLHDAYQRMSF